MACLCIQLCVIIAVVRFYQPDMRRVCVCGWVDDMTGLDTCAPFSIVEVCIKHMNYYLNYLFIYYLYLLPSVCFLPTRAHLAARGTLAC